MITKVCYIIRKKIYLCYFRFKYNNNLEIGKGFIFRKGFCINITSGKIKIGNNVFFNRHCSLNCHTSIVIGDNTIFGENVKIYDHNHKFSGNGLIKDQGFKSKEIKIGSNCWIGSNVTILKGVEIGDNVVIGANVLVYKSIPNNKIVKLKSDLIITDLL